MRIAVVGLLVVAVSALHSMAFAQPIAGGDGVLAHVPAETLAAPRDSVARAAPRPPYQMPPLAKAITDHPHNKLIHFPIVLTLVAAALLTVARKKPELQPVAFWMVWASALSVIPAYFTGKAEQEHLQGRPKEWLAAVHEKQAITIGVLQALWVLSLLKTGTRRFAWVIGIALIVMVGAAGYIGGLLAHGR